jgi:predicted nucleic acid-binding protein
MQTALVDSNVLIAAASKRDQHHDTGATIVARADMSEIPTLAVTNYVLAETVNYIAERGSQSQAIELHDRLDTSAGFEFVRTTKRDDQVAIDHLRSSKHLSFVDATIQAYAARLGIEYCYSFDDDLGRTNDLTRLADALDPYAPE